MLRIARRENIGWSTSFRCFASIYVWSPKEEWSSPKASYSVLSLSQRAEALYIS
jgi:hypothetical protein